MGITPYGDRLLVKVAAKATQSAGGIIYPDTASQSLAVLNGTVLAIGDQFGTKATTKVKEGDVIIFKRYGPAEIEVEHKSYRIVDEKDVFAVLTGA